MVRLRVLPPGQAQPLRQRQQQLPEPSSISIWYISDGLNSSWGGPDRSRALQAMCKSAGDWRCRRDRKGCGAVLAETSDTIHGCFATAGL